MAELSGVVESQTEPIKPPANIWDELRSFIRGEYKTITTETRKLRIKGEPTRVFSAQGLNALSDVSVDCRGYNAVNVTVIVTGAGAQATLSLEGATEAGSSFAPLADPNASRRITQTTAFDCPVGTAWVKVRIADITGTFAYGVGFSVIVTPYFSSGAMDVPPVLLTLAASAARTAGGNGASVGPVGHFRRFVVLCDITASATEAGDTLDVYVDVSLDGTTWLNAVHFTQQAGNGAARKEFAVLDPSNPGVAVVNVTADAAAGAVRPALFGPYLRARWAIADVAALGNQSHTFSVVAYAQE